MWIYRTDKKRGVAAFKQTVYNKTLKLKFEENLKTQFSTDRVEKIMKICEDQNNLESLKVTDFMELLIKE